MTELAVPAALLDVRTGELVEATPAKAVELLEAARQLRAQILDSVKACEYVLREESQRRGTKTLRIGGHVAEISGGTATEYDIETLNELRALGLPEERMDELIRATVTYKVDARVAKQLEASNPAYAEVVGRARRTVEKPWRVSLK